MKPVSSPLSDSNLDVYVVNLERSKDRRELMVALLDGSGVTYQFFPAVDGKKNDHPLFARYDAHVAEVRRGFGLTKGELGCYASHYLLWERCVRENRPMLIFEDDVILNGDLLTAYDAALKNIDNYGLIRFSGHKRRPWVKVETVDQALDIVRLKIGPHGTSCYAVSPSAARRLLKFADVWFEPVDCHLDRFWTHGVHCYGLAPWPVTHAAETAAESEIWQGTEREKKSRRFRKLRAVYRVRDDIGRFFSNLKFLGRWNG